MITLTAQERRNRQVIAELEKAKYCIWISDKWFINENIHHALIKKAKEGLSVEIILQDEDYITASQDFADFIAAGGEVYKASASERERFKYNEFCIVDFKTIMYGPLKREFARKDKAPRNVSIFKNFSVVTSQFTKQYFSMKNSKEQSSYVV